MNIPGTEIFRVLYGSHAHGTNTPASDEDWRGVYLLPRLYGRYGRGGVSGKDLAARFGVSRAEVSLIVNGHHWKGTEGLAEG